MCKLWRRIPRMHGPRGAALLGFGIVSIGFGLSYAGPWALEAVPGLELLSAILPLTIWGIIWIVNGAFLIAAAYKTDQARALGMTTGLFMIWTLNFAAEAILQQTRAGETRYWLTTALFAGIVIALTGLARMVNPAPTHLLVVEAPGPPEPPIGGGDGDAGS